MWDGERHDEMNEDPRILWRPICQKSPTKRYFSGSCSLCEHESHLSPSASHMLTLYCGISVTISPQSFLYHTQQQHIDSKLVFISHCTKINFCSKETKPSATFSNCITIYWLVCIMILNLWQYTRELTVPSKSWCEAHFVFDRDSKKAFIFSCISSICPCNWISLICMF